MSGTLVQEISQTSDPPPDKFALAVYKLDEKRRKALEDIDNAKYSFWHAKVCAVAGIGFFTDAYDLFAINIASIMLGYVYGSHDHQLTRAQDLGIKVATPVGTLVGQLLFGWLADRLGRKRIYGVELTIMIITTFAQALSGGGPSVSIIGTLIVWRFLNGIGIGGDYPISAVISSEFASTHIRGRMMNSVMASQGWGNFVACIVAYILVMAYKTTLVSQDKFDLIDREWRLLIGLGCVPNAIALYFRLTIPETPRFTLDVERNIYRGATDVQKLLSSGTFVHDDGTPVQKVDTPRADRRDFSTYFSKWKNLKILIGAAVSWFSVDIAYYGLGLNSSVILQNIGFGEPGTTGTQGAFDNLRNICVGNLILSAGGLIPGYWACFLFIDSWGRKPIQIMGFTVLTILFTIMGFGYDKLTATAETKKVFIFLFCLVNFFQNFGANTTSFIVPGEAFPTRYRSTAHGICAASGKLGAIIAQVGFTWLKDIGGKDKFFKHILEIFAFFMLLGICSTLLLPETKNRTLEDLSNEDQCGFVQDPEIRQNV